MRGLMGETISILRKRAEFLAANKGLRNARPGFVLLTLANDNLGKRFGVTVTRKIGNAVVRNRMKRRFRDLLRAALPGEGLARARAREGKGDAARRSRR
jgi:ribonuclease P protein component